MLLLLLAKGVEIARILKHAQNREIATSLSQWIPDTLTVGNQ